MSEPAQSPAQAIPTREALKLRTAQQHAERLRMWAKRASISTTMQYELEAAADYIEGEKPKGE